MCVRDATGASRDGVGMGAANGGVRPLKVFYICRGVALAEFHAFLPREAPSISFRSRVPSTVSYSVPEYIQCLT